MLPILSANVAGQRFENIAGEPVTEPIEHPLLLTATRFLVVNLGTTAVHVRASREDLTADPQVNTIPATTADAVVLPGQYALMAKSALDTHISMVYTDGGDTSCTLVVFPYMG